MLLINYLPQQLTNSLRFQTHLEPSNQHWLGWQIGKYFKIVSERKNGLELVVANLQHNFTKK